MSSSSFTHHTVQLVSQNKEDEELAHIKEHVSTIKDAISTLENLDMAGYAEDLGDLRRDLAQAVIHQVRMMKERTEQYKHHRTNEVASDQFANQLVSTAPNSLFPRSTPLSALGSSPDTEATQYPPMFEATAEDEQEHWIQHENPAQFDKLLYASFGKVTAGSMSSWSRIQPNLMDFTRIVQIHGVLKDVTMVEDRAALEKWIRLVGERLIYQWNLTLYPKKDLLKDLVDLTNQFVLYQTASILHMCITCR